MSRPFRSALFWTTNGTAKEVDVVDPKKLLTELMQIGLAETNLGWRDYFFPKPGRREMTVT